MTDNPPSAMLAAMSGEHIAGWVLISVCGPIILFGGLVVAVLWYRNWRIYHPRRYRPTRRERRAARYDPVFWTDPGAIDQIQIPLTDEESSPR